MDQEKLTRISIGLSDLFDEIAGSMKEFKKKTYADKFQYYVEKYKPVLKAIPELYHESEGSEEVLDALVGILPSKTVQKLADIPQKRKRELKILDYNLAMVSYVIPLLNNVRDDCMDIIIDKIIERWNQNFPTGKIGKSTFDSIQGGFKSGLCYITTAVCESMGKSDDCYELNLLRDYRDQYLMGDTRNGSELVKKYYDIAPTIVKHINKKADAKFIYEQVWNTYLSPCIELIELNQREACQTVYADMVQDLHRKYFYS